MIACRFRVLAFALLVPLTLPVLEADVTLRYKQEMKMNPNLPAPLAVGMSAAGMSGMGSAAQETLLQLKGGKGFSTAAGFNSITDFTTQEITLLDAAGSRYAKLKSDQLIAEMAGGMPKIPAEASAIMGSMKFEVSPPKVTGRSAVILGVETEEREIVISIGGPAIPGMPAGPLVKMVMQFWSAKPGEVLRVQAIRELTGYSLWSYATMNPAASMETMMKQLPGFGDSFLPMIAEMQKGTTILRMHVDMFMPAMAMLMKQMPAGAGAVANPGAASLDSDAPLMQMNQEAVELSSTPLPDSIFQIPEGYREAPSADLVKGFFAKIQASVKK